MDAEAPQISCLVDRTVIVDFDTFPNGTSVLPLNYLNSYSQSDGLRVVGRRRGRIDNQLDDLARQL